MINLEVNAPEHGFHENLIIDSIWNRRSSYSSYSWWCFCLNNASIRIWKILEINFWDAIFLAQPSNDNIRDEDAPVYSIAWTLKDSSLKIYELDDLDEVVTAQMIYDIIRDEEGLGGFMIFKNIYSWFIIYGENINMNIIILYPEWNHKKKSCIIINSFRGNISGINFY